MEPVLYFYSTDGTTTFGPVTEDALRQLLRDQVIGPASFICPQGESEWKPVDLGRLRRIPPQTPRLPRYEPPPYVPTDKAKQREEELAQRIEEKFDEGPQPFLFRWGGMAFALAATILLGLMQEGTPNIVAGLIGGVLMAYLIPYIVGQSFKPAWRLRVRVIAMVGLLALTLLFRAFLAVPLMRAMQAASTGATAPGMPSDSARVAVPTAKASVSDDPDTLARMVRAAQPVQQEMIDKVKTSDEAEKACGNFDPATLATQSDLTALRNGLTKLRAAQSDVLSYFQNYDDRCRTAMSNGGFSADGVERFVASVHQSGRIDQAVAIWQLRIKLTDDHLARLDFLDKHWGNWQPKNGQLLFVNQSDLDNYNALTQALAIDIQRGNELQKIR